MVLLGYRQQTSQRKDKPSLFLTAICRMPFSSLSCSSVHCVPWEARPDAQARGDQDPQNLCLCSGDPTSRGLVGVHCLHPSPKHRLGGILTPYTAVIVSLDAGDRGGDEGPPKRAGCSDGGARDCHGPGPPVPMCQ